MRIIAGRYRGHRLTGFKGDHLRPTTDRVKETIFNILMPYLDGAQVLDLFSGTGNLGIESLSRGAKEVFFVEKNPKSLKIIKENLGKLNITKDYQIISQDVFRFLQNSLLIFDVILIDPPFTHKIGHEVMENLAKSRLWNEETLIVIESSCHEKMEEAYPPLFLFKKRNFGDKILSVFRFKENSKEDSEQTDSHITAHNLKITTE